MIPETRKGQIVIPKDEPREAFDTYHTRRARELRNSNIAEAQYKEWKAYGGVGPNHTVKHKLRRNLGRLEKQKAWAEQQAALAAGMANMEIGGAGDGEDGGANKE